MIGKGILTKINFMVVFSLYKGKMIADHMIMKTQTQICTMMLKHRKSSLSKSKT